MFPFAATRSAARAAPPQSVDSAALLERSPGLRDGAERVLASIVKSLQTMAGQSTTVDGMVAGVSAMPMRDVVLAHRPEAIAATIGCAGLSCTLLVTLDPTLVHSIVELLAGGNGNEPPPSAPRAATSIDQQYAQIIVTLAASAIETEWAANGFGTSRAQRLDGGVAADICGPRISQAGVIAMALGIFGWRGMLSLVLPPVALDAFRHTDVAVPEPVSPPDPAWNAMLQRELGRAPVQVAAYLDAQELSLGAIAQLQPGQLLMLPASAKSRASLVCDGRTLYRGELGQDAERFSLRIDEIVAEARAPSADQTYRRHTDLAKAS